MLGGALVSLVVAGVLYARFGINGYLSRDESIYAYAGQQMAQGVALYDSIFDPKGPGASLLAGLGAAVGHLIGGDDLVMIRIAFFVCSCLTVLAIYLLAHRLWHSVVAGIVAAVVFASFNGFAQDALSGPDAKTPGILAAVLAMWLTASRRWLWAGLVGSLALLVWQPLAIYLPVSVLTALLWAPAGRRWTSAARVVVGGAIPLVAVSVYFAAAGVWDRFIESAFTFPATAKTRSHASEIQHLQRIDYVIHHYYHFSGWLLEAGLVALVILVVALLVRHIRQLGTALRRPLIIVVALTFAVQAGFAAIDFQGYQDVFPLLAYGALGIGGVVGVLLHALDRSRASRAVAAVFLVGVTVLAVFSWSWFGSAPYAKSAHGLRRQRANACAIERMLIPGHPLYALGDPVHLVLTHQRNPDRYVYLGAGVDTWKMKHTPGGFEGWGRQILATHPSVISVGGGWHRPIRHRMESWIRQHGYQPGYVGGWHVFTSAAARAQARHAGVRITRKPTKYAVDSHGHMLPAGQNCQG